MGKASSKKRSRPVDPATGRFEPAGPMNDLVLRNYAKTTLAAAEHLVGFYQVVIDHGEFQDVKGASCISFVLALLAQNIRDQLTLKPSLEDPQAIARVAKSYPAIFSVDGAVITRVEGRQ